MENEANARQWKLAYLRSDGATIKVLTEKKMITRFIYSDVLVNCFYTFVVLCSIDVVHQHTQRF